MGTRKRLLLASMVGLAVLLPGVAGGAAQASTVSATATAATTGVAPGCVVQPGRFQVLANPAMSHTIKLTSPEIICSSTSKYTVVVTYTILRYWVATKTWKPEAHYSGHDWNHAYALNDPFDCKTPGALMAMKAVYRFNQSPIGLVSTATYNGRTTALCSR